MRKRDKIRELLGKSPGNSVPPESVPHRQAVQNVPNEPKAATTTPEAAAAKTAVTTHTAAGNRALQLAIERHLNALPEADKDAFRQASKQITSESLLSNVKAYDENHKQVSQFRPHAEALSRFLGVLDRFMAGVAIGIQAHPDIASIVVGAVRIVIDLAVSFVTFFARLSEMLCRFSDFLAPLTKYAEVSTKDELVQESLANVYADLLQFCHRARGIFIDQKGVKRRWTSWRVFWRLQWVPFEEEFGKIESDMQHHLDVLRHSAHALGLNATLNASRSERDRRERERGMFFHLKSALRSARALC
jgi:ankyrin repeat domain-containing protein 50